MNCIAYLVSDYLATSHTFVRREIAALRASGAHIRIFTIRGEGSGGEDGEVTKILGRSPLAYVSALILQMLRHPIIMLDAWILANRHRVPGLKAWLWAQFHFVEAVLLSRLLARGNCRHLHNHFANSGAVIGMVAARIAGIPWSLTLHGISELDYPAGPLLGDKIRRAQFVACASYFMRAQAMRTVSAEQWYKLRVVRCGIDLGQIPAGGSVAGGASPRLVCVGRFSPEKAHIGLIDALATLAQEGLEFHATLVGDGPTRPDIEAAARKAGIADRLRFTGALPAEETLGEIAQAEIFVLPSLMEGLPMVLIEALACRTASIASAVAGIPELIVDGVTGLTFTPSDWLELSTGLRRLIENPDLRHRLEQEGRRVVEENFSIDAVAVHLLDEFSRSAKFAGANSDRLKLG